MTGHTSRRWFRPFPAAFTAECECGETFVAATAEGIDRKLAAHLRDVDAAAIAWETSEEHSGLQGALILEGDASAAVQGALL